MEEHRSIIKEVFGESSDSEDDDQQIQLDDPNAEFHSQLIFGKSPSWEPVSQINGLSLCRDLLSHDQQSSLLSAIDNGACILHWVGNQLIYLYLSNLFRASSTVKTSSKTSQTSSKICESVFWISSPSIFLFSTDIWIWFSRAPFIILFLSWSNELKIKRSVFCC